MDVKAHDPPAVAAFFSAVLAWRFSVDEQDWRQATKITAGGEPIGGVSDLSSPIYPPGTPAHVAYYLAVDDVDQRVTTATANGARLVVAPFEAGNQGRIATLVDPAGAHFSIWRPNGPGGWAAAPRGPQRMVLACSDPAQAERFYRETLGAAVGSADFVTATAHDSPTPQWEACFRVDDLDAVAAHARTHGQEPVALRYGGRAGLRLSSPEGHVFRIQPRQR